MTAANATKPPVPADAPYIVNAPAPDLSSPYVHQATFTVEQSLGPKQSITFSYVGAFGRRLLLSETFPVNSATIASLNAVTNNAASGYNSFQTQFQHRLDRNLQILSSFTWSHSIDNASSPNSANGNALQPGFLERQRGDSDFDVHTLASTAISYSLPIPRWNRAANALLGHWGTDMIYRCSGGTPFDVVGNTVIDPITSTTYISRPNVVAGVPQWIEGNYPGGRRVNINAFTAAASGMAGNMRRNALRGFSMHQVDLSLRRDFPFTERLHLQFRADLFNSLNKPSFGNPPVTLGQPATFGIANSMLSDSLATATSFSPLYQVGAPQSTQLSLKLLF
ncbi:MAG: TonB-dependent receptor plug [Acidobacteriaceae bacterium]|nr:TonB-dependent receptor plug [Acidobacteriaceae bacterium]